MNIRTLYEATAREHLRSNGIYPPTKTRMTFDEWWLLQNPEHLDELAAKEVWAVAIAAERERCARVAEGMERPDERHWVPDSLYDKLRRETAAEIRRQP